MNPKDRVEELQARGRRRRGAEVAAEIKTHGAAMRQIFATSRCDVCAGPIVRHESGRGFVCGAGHAADKNAAKRRRDAASAASGKDATRGMELAEARLLQARRGRP